MKFILIIFIFFILSCNSKSTDPKEISNDPNLKETGVSNECDENSDCWCQVFTGTEFIPGEKAPAICCFELNNTNCTVINRCMQCGYL